MRRPDRLSPTQAHFLTRPGLAAIFDLLEAARGEVRVNGGAVRNALLGEAVSDIDLSTTLPPGEVVNCLEDGGVRTVPTGIQHGTVTAISDGYSFEITTLREDIETDGRHAVVRFGTNWAADASRRDFTMNALYCDREGQLFDPLGGYDDLVARRVRFIGEAAERIVEDHLRILRFFRFYALYGDGRPDAEGLRACVRLREGLRNLSAERVWAELRRILGAPDPRRAVLWMRSSGILQLLLPESEKWGVDLLAPLVAAQIEAAEQPDPLLRLMAIIPPRHDPIAALADRLRLAGAERQRLERWVQATGELAEISPADVGKDLLRHELYRWGRQAVLDNLRLIRARMADRDDTSLSQLTSAIDFASKTEIPQLPVQGRDLIDMGHPPGPQIGEMLSLLETRWIKADFQPDRAKLLEWAKSHFPTRDRSGQ